MRKKSQLYVTTLGADVHAAAYPAAHRTMLLEDLHHRYGGAAGGSLRTRLKYARKRYLWKLVVGGANLSKRIIDIAVALIAMLLLAPVFLAVALTIKLTDRGPVFFWQKRVGQWGAEFPFPKFRSMVTNAEALKDRLLASNDHANGVTFKMKKDPRVTWIGRLIRKASIDELPQLWCVLRGEMSLVGPRPPVPREVALYSLEDRRRLDVKPGLTCIWQVSGRGDIPFERQVELDVQYIDSQSIWFDILLLLKNRSRDPVWKRRLLMSSERQRIIEQFEGRFSARAIRRRRINHVVQSNGWLIWIQVLSGVRRSLEFLLASLLLVLLAPLFPILFIAVKARGGGVLRTPRLGRWGCTFNEILFSSGPFAGLPALLNVLRGDMSLVGPRAVSPGDISGADRAAWRRFNIRPGFICLWWIRQRANIAWGSESDADSEYLDTQSFWGDFAIGLRAIPAAFYGEGVTVAPERVELMGIAFNNLTMEEAVAEIVRHARNPDPAQLCFVNADCVNIACHDVDYKALLANSAIVLADGIGLKLAGKILNSNIRQNVNGTDLFPQLCGALAKKDLGIYLLGGKPGVPEDVARWIAEHYPDTPVSGFRHGFFTAADTCAILEDIRRSGAAILLVALGVPKQEKWIRDNLDRSGVSMAMGVGGLFDFYSGRVPRAPVWIREIGMEWLYRFAQEPRRMWRRYFVGNFIFLVRALSERFLSRKQQTRRGHTGREEW